MLGLTLFGVLLGVGVDDVSLGLILVRLIGVLVLSVLFVLMVRW